MAIDFLTRVPEQGGLDNGTLTDASGRLPRDGPVVANVPGTVAGMEMAFEEFGSGNVPWSDLLAPAVRAASDGFVLDDAFTTTLAVERHRYEKHPSSVSLFFRDGEPIQPGDTLRNPDLAWTLRQIAEHGADAFYRGEVAERLMTDLRSHGNAISLSDLPLLRGATRARPGSFRGHGIFGSAPPTSGGAGLVAKLQLLDQVASGGPYHDDAAKAHAMIEAWKLQPSTFGRIADPGLWPVDVRPFESADTARARWRCFDPAVSLRTPVDLEESGCRRALGHHMRPISLRGELRMGSGG